MGIQDIPLTTLDGSPSTLGALGDKALLVVNVASKCGLTPQYEGLERLQKRYADRGFSVVGFPCNQFAGQEPGSAEEIQEFCSTTYGVSFPLFEKIDVNGESRHPLYAELTKVADAEGAAGDVQWNSREIPGHRRRLGHSLPSAHRARGRDRHLRHRRRPRLGRAESATPHWCRPPRRLRDKTPHSTSSAAQCPALDEKHTQRSLS